LTEKFQVLVRDATISGVVTETDGTDFDLALDSAFWRLRLLFPLFPTVHCERYGYDDLPGLPGDTPPLAVGQRIAVSGALVLDNYVHAEERAEHPERIVQRGLLRAFRPKPELHPYDPASITVDPPTALRTASIRWFEETYSPEWIPNRILGRGGDGVGMAVVDRIDLLVRQ
jgi:hypothetical protein